MKAPRLPRRRPRRRPLRRRRRGRRPLPPVSVVPTIITLGNLVAGFAAIHYASKPIDASGPWGWTSLTMAGALIFIGMACDAVDGSVARITRSTSELGAQLDSLADLVTFGVAPAFMMLRLVSHMLAGDRAAPIVGPEADSELAKVLWAIAAAYVVATALRLARFNVETPSAAAEDHMVFRGLPSPGAAGAIASLILLHQHLLASPEGLDDPPGILSQAFAFAIPGVTLACAAAMVSGLPYLHVMNRYVSGARSFGYVARIALPLFALLLWFQETMAVGFTAYALSAPARRLAVRLRLRRGRGVPAATPRAAAPAGPDADSALPHGGSPHASAGTAPSRDSPGDATIDPADGPTGGASGAPAGDAPGDPGGDAPGDPGGPGRAGVDGPAGDDRSATPGSGADGEAAASTSSRGPGTLRP